MVGSKGSKGCSCHVLTIRVSQPKHAKSRCIKSITSPAVDLRSNSSMKSNTCMDRQCVLGSETIQQPSGVILLLGAEFTFSCQGSTWRMRGRGPWHARQAAMGEGP